MRGNETIATDKEGGENKGGKRDILIYLYTTRLGRPERKKKEKFRLALPYPAQNLLDNSNDPINDPMRRRVAIIPVQDSRRPQ